MLLSFVKSLVPDRGCPIGLDLGRSSVRMLQAQRVENDLRISWADAREVQTGDHNADDCVDTWFSAVREMLKTGQFRSNRATLVLPAFATHVRHVRIPRTAEAELPAVINEALEDKLPGHPTDFALRWVVAGEVFGEQSPQQEIVVMAVARGTVEHLFRAAEQVKLDIAGVTVAPRAVVDCFENVYRRKADADAVNLIVDLGASAVRAVVATAGGIRFARTIHLPTGDLDEATTEKLAAELDLCRRYHESCFPNLLVSRLIFVGGGAVSKTLCQSIAQSLGIAAQLGDPLVRFNRSESTQFAALDRRKPQPAWAAVVGASLGSPKLVKA
jgi:Tfp pilus assembly PilM family ATPase